MKKYKLMIVVDNVITREIIESPNKPEDILRSFVIDAVREAPTDCFRSCGISVSCSIFDYVEGM